MNGPRECHTEGSKSDREGRIPHSIPYICNLKINDTNELTKQKETHQGPGVQHRELCSMLCGSLNGSGRLG